MASSDAVMANIGVWYLKKDAAKYSREVQYGKPASGRVAAQKG